MWKWLCMYVHLQLHFQAILHITGGVGEPGKFYDMQGCDLGYPPQATCLSPRISFWGGRVKGSQLHIQVDLPSAYVCIMLRLFAMTQVHNLSKFSGLS